MAESCGTLSGVDVSNEKARERLASAVKARRKTLKIGQDDVAKLGGPSRATMNKIENGGASNYADDTIAALEAILGWKEGGARLAADGREPELREDGPWTPGAADGEQVEVTFRGWKFTLTPRPGATPDEVKAAQADIIAGVLRRLGELGLDDSPDT